MAIVWMYDDILPIEGMDQWKLGISAYTNDRERVLHTASGNTGYCSSVTYFQLFRKSEHTMIGGVADRSHIAAEERVAASGPKYVQMSEGKAPWRHPRKSPNECLRQGSLCPLPVIRLFQEAFYGDIL
jgi:hypothetical protein